LGQIFSLYKGFWFLLMPAFSNKSLALTFGTRGAPPFHENATTVMSAFFDEAKNLTGVTVTVAKYAEYPSFGVFIHDELIDSTKSIGFNFTTVVPGQVQGGDASWLLPREVTAPENAEMIAKLIVNTTVFGIPL
jgi:hypothetical protein